ncbi:hypothetical protein J8273_7498 [Carpediemonas membranifera]|uniref:Uncharacterized protein n=1 Tax=Carpediemonas membranifera TaxID=201153 RepID=A0A8J6DXY6_9EUKA|nr:hypothetical protein J8273_7498 [Carpediemonas membranifera]|eukprot:KAG9391224.1 hypothetical protein J8273_7498 [Carpediemonas membranifera]
MNAEVLTELRVGLFGETGAGIGAAQYLFGPTVLSLVADGRTTMPQLDLGHIFMIHGNSHEQTRPIFVENLVRDVANLATAVVDDAPPASFLNLHVGSRTFSESDLGDTGKIFRPISDSLLDFNCPIWSTALVWTRPDSLPPSLCGAATFSEFIPLLITKHYTLLSRCPHEAKDLVVGAVPHSVGSTVLFSELEACIFAAVYGQADMTLGGVPDSICLKLPAPSQAPILADLKGAIDGVTGIIAHAVLELTRADPSATARSPRSIGTGQTHPAVADTRAVQMLALAAVLQGSNTAGPLAVLGTGPVGLLTALAEGVASFGRVVALRKFFFGWIGRVEAAVSAWEPRDGTWQCRLLDSARQWFVQGAPTPTPDGLTKFVQIISPVIRNTRRCQPIDQSAVRSWVCGLVPKSQADTRARLQGMFDGTSMSLPGRSLVPEDRGKLRPAHYAHYVKYYELGRFVTDFVASRPETALDARRILSDIALHYSNRVSLGLIRPLNASFTQYLPMDHQYRALAQPRMQSFPPAAELMSVVFRKAKTISAVDIYSMTGNESDLDEFIAGCHGSIVDSKEEYGDAIVTLDPTGVQFPVVPSFMKSMVDRMPDAMIRYERGNFTAIELDPIVSYNLMHIFEIFHKKLTKAQKNDLPAFLRSAGQVFTPAHFPGLVHLHEFHVHTSSQAEIAQIIAERLIDIAEDRGVGVSRVDLGPVTVTPESMSHQSVALARDVAACLSAGCSPVVHGTALLRLGGVAPFELTMVSVGYSTLNDSTGRPVDLEDEVGNWDADDSCTPIQASASAVSRFSHMGQVCFPCHLSFQLASPALQASPPVPRPSPVTGGVVPQLTAVVVLLETLRGLLESKRGDQAALAVAGMASVTLAALDCPRWSGVIAALLDVLAGWGSLSKAVLAGSLEDGVMMLGVILEGIEADGMGSTEEGASQA